MDPRDKLQELYPEEEIEYTLSIVVDRIPYNYKIKRLNNIQVTFLIEENEFLNFAINPDDYAICNITLGEKEKNGFTCIIVDGKKLSPLETTFYIRTYLCHLLGITHTKILDVAHIHNANKLKLIPYRIFATKIPLENISIYSKFYKKRIPEFTEEDQKNLRDIRDISLFDLLGICERQIELLKTKIQDPKFLLRKNVNTKLLNCIERIFILKDLMGLSDKLHSFYEKYSKLFEKISRYICLNTESIYYESVLRNQSLFKPLKKKKSVKKRKSKKKAKK